MNAVPVTAFQKPPPLLEELLLEELLLEGLEGGLLAALLGVLLGGLLGVLLGVLFAPPPNVSLNVRPVIAFQKPPEELLLEELMVEGLLAATSRRAPCLDSFRVGP